VRGGEKLRWYEEPRWRACFGLAGYKFRALLTASETIGVERGYQRVYLAGEYLPRKEAADKRAERHAAMGNGFIVARDRGDRTHTRETIFGYRADADPSTLDPCILKRRDYPSDTLQQFWAKRVFQSGGADFELPINGAVVYEDVPWAVGTDVDSLRVQDPPHEGGSFYGEAQEQALARLERQQSFE
jgi:hypothetical protein